MCIVRVSCLHSSVDFLEFLPGNRNHQVVIVKLANAKLKMKTLPAGFSVALCGTAIQFSDRHSNRSFLLLRIANLDVADVLVVTISEIAACPPSEHLAFQGILFSA